MYILELSSVVLQCSTSAIAGQVEEHLRHSPHTLLGKVVSEGKRLHLSFEDIEGASTSAAGLLCDLIVLRTEPTFRGTIGSHTAIVVLAKHAKSAFTVEPLDVSRDPFFPHCNHEAQCRFRKDRVWSSEAYCEKFFALKLLRLSQLSAYFVCSAASNRSSYANAKLMKRIRRSITVVSNSAFPVVVPRCRVITFDGLHDLDGSVLGNVELLPQLSGGVPLDITNAIWVHPTIFRKFWLYVKRRTTLASSNVSSPLLAIVSLHRRSSDPSSTVLGESLSSRIASLGYYYHSEDCSRCGSEDLVVLHHLCWHNLSSAAVSINTTHESLILCLKPFYKTISFAKDVQLAAIATPSDKFGKNASDNMVTILQRFFGIPRILQSDDILCIKQPASFARYWFKVVKIGAVNSSIVREVDARQCFFVDRAHSSLYQVSGITCRLPSFIYDELFHRFVPLKKLVEGVAAVAKLAAMKHALPISVLLEGDSGSGKSTIAQAVAALCGLHLVEFDCFELWSEAAGSSEAKIRNAFDKARSFGAGLLLLKHIEVIGKELTSGFYDLRILDCFRTSLQGVDSNETFVCMAATQRSTDLPLDVVSLFSHCFKVGALDDYSKSRLLAVRPSLAVDEIVQKTTDFSLADFDSLRQETKLATLQRLAEFSKKSRSCLEKERSVAQAAFSSSHSDIAAGLEKLENGYSTILGTPKVPDVRWQDIGGLEEAKGVIMDTIQLAVDHSHSFAAHMVRTGIVLHGPPGCGKTMLAKAVAKQSQMRFMSVKGPELINKFVGQSEENIRDLFAKARLVAPCILFFDEIDSLAQNRGKSGDSGGVMDRVVSQLLAELDNVKRNVGFFVIAATNRLDLVDSALLRPGRFDKQVYVGIKNDADSRLNVLKAVVNRMTLSDDVSLGKIIDKCPDHMSGADFYALAANALQSAIARRIRLSADESSEVCAELSVNSSDFAEALKTFRASFQFQQSCA